jgi:dihydrofolate reductase
MAKLVFGMNQSLDGYVDHTAFAPGRTLFRHFIEQVGGLTGSIYGRRMYEVMRYWDDDDRDWDGDFRAFAEAWRGQPKWVVSRTLTSVGPNATLVEGDLEAAVRALKDGLGGEIEVGGPELAHALGEARPRRRVRHLSPSGRARRRQAVLRRPPAAAALRRQRDD